MLNVPGAVNPTSGRRFTVINQGSIRKDKSVNFSTRSLPGGTGVSPVANVPVHARR